MALCGVRLRVGRMAVMDERGEAGVLLPPAATVCECVDTFEDDEATKEEEEKEDMMAAVRRCGRCWCAVWCAIVEVPVSVRCITVSC